MTYIFNKKSIIVVFILALSSMGSATATELTTMQKIERTIPTPILMMHLVKHADDLFLSNEQVAIFTKWRRDNLLPTEAKVDEVIAIEAEIKRTIIHKSTTQADIDELKEILFELRGELIDIRLRCFKNVHKVLDDDQWAQLLELEAAANPMTIN